MQESVLTQVLLPIALGIIMLGMGLALTVADFRGVLKAPKAALIGVVCQMLLLPLLGFAVVTLFAMPPELAIGLMILTFCPGGTTSNIITYLARGDVAVSVSLTAVVSLVTPITIPLLTVLAGELLGGPTTSFTMPFAKTIGALLIITVVPVAIGMAINAKWPAAAARAEKPVKIFSIVVLVAIIAGIVRQNADQIGAMFAAVGAPTIVLNLAAMALGYGVARAARLGRAQTTAITVEVGIQNGTLTFLITMTLLSNQTMAIPAAAYSIVMFVTGGLFAWWRLRSAGSAQPAPASTVGG